MCYQVYRVRCLFVSRLKSIADRENQDPMMIFDDKLVVEPTKHRASMQAMNEVSLCLPFLP